ncbi:MAG: hypothetical protein LBG96_11055 [Tannerella sp.]|nr:hypothetical protein [Tannerella sp.]
MDKRNFIKTTVYAGLGLLGGVPLIRCSKGGDDNGEENNNSGKGNSSKTTVKVGEVLPDWEEGYLDIHAISTGRGESTLYIFPDGTTLMVDAAGSLLSMTDPIPPTPHKPNSNITSGQVIVDYANHFIRPANSKLNYLMLTHWDPDHMGSYSTSTPLDASGTFRLTGVTEVGAKIRFDKMIDRDYPNYSYPTTFDANRRNNYLKFLDWAKTNYGATVEQFDVGSASQIILKQNPSKYGNFQVRNLIGNGWMWTGSGTGKVNLLPGNVAEVVAADPAENVFSCAFHLQYGKFNYFAGGDLQFNGRSTYPWKDVEAPLINIVTGVDVMKANHHGTSNTNSQELLNKLRPSTVLIHPWRDVQPNPDTIGRFLTANSSCRIFNTGITTANETRLSAHLSKLYSTHGHIVVRVEPQGAKYSVYVLDDSNQDFKVKKISGPYESN